MLSLSIIVPVLLRNALFDTAARPFRAGGSEMALEIAGAFENSFQHQPPTKIKMKILIIAILSTALCASPVTISLAETPKIYVCPDCGCPSDNRRFDKPGACPE
jgi:hypothetical protein